MRILLLFLLVLTCVGVCVAQTESKCFRSEWLQGERSVNFTITGNKVSGAFTVGSSDDPETRTYPFSGTRRGNILFVGFANKQLPDVSPSEMNSLVWTLVNRGGKQQLRINFLGKNYETNRYQDGFVYFEPCESGYAALAKTAEAVHFAKGASSSSFPLRSRADFQAMRSPATFSLKALKGQKLEIQAHGCAIEIYLPNEKFYEFVEAGGADAGRNHTQLDRTTIEALPLSGTYLVVLRKAAENMRPETVTFEVN